MGKRIAIVGASGFVGVTLLERALAREERGIVPIIHTSGNAWRLARWGVPAVAADLLDKESIARALKGCTHVVNCSRGGNEVMSKGLSNLLEVSGDLKIEGFVHLSSVLVYGDPPAPNSVTEAGDTQPESGTYGWVKLAQDAVVQRFASAGLRCSILCPPNIGGTYSPFLQGLLEAIRTDSFALVDDGNAVLNLVDVHNLCHAIECALDRCANRVQRIFVTDDELSVWRDIAAPLATLAERTAPLRRISADELRKIRDSETAAVRSSIARSLKHLVSSEVREALRKDPLLARGDAWLRRMAGRLGSKAEEALRLSIEGPVRIARPADAKPLAVSLCMQQLRGVRHSCEEAKRQLDYRPEYTVAASMRAFEKWYRAHMGMDSDAWPLLRQLMQPP
jgi:nucleoside-diphosphate-sugar epimerase